MMMSVGQYVSGYVDIRRPNLIGKLKRSMRSHSSVCENILLFEPSCVASFTSAVRSNDDEHAIMQCDLVP